MCSCVLCVCLKDGVGVALFVLLCAFVVVCFLPCVLVCVMAMFVCCLGGVLCCCCFVFVFVYMCCCVSVC